MAQQLKIENARIGFKNFAGVEGQYNREGQRNFVVFLDEAFAQQLQSEGWNIKFPKERDGVDPDNDSRQPYLPVELKFHPFPCRITMLTRIGVDDYAATKVTEETAAMLDYIDYDSVDLIIRPYNWSVNGNSGVKAYLQSGYFNLVVDDFAIKYGLSQSDILGIPMQPVSTQPVLEVPRERKQAEVIDVEYID